MDSDITKGDTVVITTYLIFPKSYLNFLPFLDYGHVYTATSIEQICVDLLNRWESALPSTQFVHVPER